jgi:hypothetical protein
MTAPARTIAGTQDYGVAAYCCVAHSPAVRSSCHASAASLMHTLQQIFLAVQTTVAGIKAAANAAALVCCACCSATAAAAAAAPLTPPLPVGLPLRQALLGTAASAAAASPPPPPLPTAAAKDSLVRRAMATPVAPTGLTQRTNCYLEAAKNELGTQRNSTMPRC